MLGNETGLKMNSNEYCGVLDEEMEDDGDLKPTSVCYTCTLCNFQTYSWLSLTKHSATCESMKNEDETSHGNSLSSEKNYTTLYKCKRCPYRSRWKMDCSRHVLRNHLGNLNRLEHDNSTTKEPRWDKCQLCQKSVNFLKIIVGKSDTLKLCKICWSKYTKHCGSSAPERHACKHCVFQTDLKVILHEHCKVYHGNLKNNSALPRILDCYKCKKCDFQTYSLLVLAKHIVTCKIMENEEITYNNLIAKESYTNVQCWIYHDDREDNGGQKPKFCYKCEKCGFKAYSLAALTNHIASRKCMEHARKAADSKRHMQTVFAKEREDNGNQKTKFCYKCGKCDFQAETFLALSRHTATCNPLNCDNEATQSKDGRTLFDCDLCKDRFKWECDCGRHLLCKHTGCRYNVSENVKWCRCPHCRCKFQDRWDLKEHIMEKHSQSDQTECNTYSGKATDENTSRRNIAGVLPRIGYINWFQCKQCKFATSDRNFLKSHIEVKHTVGKSSIWCEHNYFKTDHNCGKQNEKLTPEVDNLDIVRWYKCGYCKFKTTVKGNLRSHMELEHLH